MAEGTDHDVDHYFTAQPASPGDLRPLAVRLGGRELQLATASGVFSPDRLDTGTQVLLREAPAPPAHGDLLDLGCGWGPVALHLALTSPEARVWGVDVNERSVDLLRRNAEHLGLPGVRACLPDDVPDDVRFGAIWSNPPIRVGKAVLHDLLLRWLPRLDDGASAYLVVQKNLGSDSLQRWLAEQVGPQGFVVDRYASAKGFRVLHVQAP
ncbi:class I SAM-dependent methyltransferase [Angustibacter sp. Root456]|uniref:class I SAM-dependent methyltransferase n=1 Tax=Angustibacter sp. Root456 TaxID=1736539 RepID=UPI0006FFE966|nr:methyltransferase [Angustibacter sp. Root456]KQX63636.1 16S rRNA methyltransferase [Angustibacter sp. Root456]